MFIGEYVEFSTDVFLPEGTTDLAVLFILPSTGGRLEVEVDTISITVVSVGSQLSGTSLMSPTITQPDGLSRLATFGTVSNVFDQVQDAKDHLIVKIGYAVRNSSDIANGTTITTSSNVEYDDSAMTVYDVDMTVMHAVDLEVRTPI